MDKRIYKKDSNGNIRYLSISTESNIIIQESGIVGTNSPIFNRSACEAKNIGKANSTTPAEQAVLEANSKITEKMRLGYFDSIEEAQEKGGKDFLLPMLAKDYKKEFKKVTYPCYIQPKLDGMRSLACNEFGFISRTGKLITTIDHIDLEGFEDVILDGELYAHGISFQENMKLIKKYRKDETEQVKYHVYDIVMDAPFSERHRLLTALIDPEVHTTLEIVPTYIVNNEEEMKVKHIQFISEGYEGTMIRHSDEGYAVNKRSSQLLKYKDFLDEVYEVIDVWPSEARPEQGIVRCQLNTKKWYRLNDKEVVIEIREIEFPGATYGYPPFSCGMKFSHFDRKMILAMKEEYIGQMAEVRFFEYTDGGLPRFPVCVGFRLDK